MHAPWKVLNFLSFYFPSDAEKSKKVSLLQLVSSFFILYLEQNTCLYPLVTN